VADCSAGQDAVPCSGDGLKDAAGPSVTWERQDFPAPDFFSATILESRNLHVSLLQLVQIGPLVCLLFQLTVSAAILARQPLTGLQMLTIAAGYAFYFPLIVYLSARFRFAVAMSIAVVVPGRCWSITQDGCWAGGAACWPPRSF
jgi:hypothetical protein